MKLLFVGMAALCAALAFWLVIGTRSREEHESAPGTPSASVKPERAPSDPGRRRSPEVLRADPSMPESPAAPPIDEVGAATSSERAPSVAPAHSISAALTEAVAEFEGIEPKAGWKRYDNIAFTQGYSGNPSPFLHEWVTEDQEAAMNDCIEWDLAWRRDRGSVTPTQERAFVRLGRIYWPLIISIKQRFQTAFEQAERARLAKTSDAQEMRRRSERLQLVTTRAMKEFNAAIIAVFPEEAR